MLALADGVTITVGHNVWSIGLNFILYLIIAAVVGVIAEYIVGWRLPLGIIGAIIAGIVGAWLMTQVITINGIGDIPFWCTCYSSHNWRNTIDCHLASNYRWFCTPSALSNRLGKLFLAEGSLQMD